LPPIHWLRLLKQKRRDLGRKSWQWRLGEIRGSKVWRHSRRNKPHFAQIKQRLFDRAVRTDGDDIDAGIQFGGANFVLSIAVPSTRPDNRFYNRIG
jgi:hypothetical protein